MPEVRHLSKIIFKGIATSPLHFFINSMEIPSMLCAFFGFSLSMMETMSVKLTSTLERELFVRGAEVGGMVLSVSKILQ